MTKSRNQQTKNRLEQMSQTDQKAIVEALSRPHGAYNEEARRVLGNPLGYVEGRPMTQPEIVACMMAATVGG
jgi:hypothetical protein